MHNLIYSDQGRWLGLRHEWADRHLLSDYSYSRFTTGYRHAIALGDTPHQTLEFSADLGNATGGRSDLPTFSLGGSQGLRGYSANSFEGEAYYLLSVAALRPVGWNWLRAVVSAVVSLEADNAYPEADQIDSSVRWSLGLGLRIRFTRLVNLDIETGIALPLDHDSGRFYAHRAGW